MTETTVRQGPHVSMLHGLPFIDDGFGSPILLAGAIAVRQRAALTAGLCVEGSVPADERWLLPERAVQMRPGAKPIPHRALTCGQRTMIADAIDRLRTEMPAWGPLFNLPVRYVGMEESSAAISASSILWPQHILLGMAAFETRNEVREQLVHEMCHQWLYLVEELWPLEPPGARRLILPSGTPDREPREVLGAAHVAAALVRLYRAVGADDQIQMLLDYGRECLALLDEDTDLTDTGRFVAQRLKEAL
jgi:hypothetical protein